MRPHHTLRLTESVSRLAAEFLARRGGGLAHHGSMGTLVTVTGTRLDKSGRGATVFVTVYPASAEAQALAEIRTWRRDLRDFLDTRLRGSPLTHIDFALDIRATRDRENS
ncbi:MAG: hypothetical protein AAB415_01000 [Patescibacteria group bacterium]|mgnify:CR=1 FL=1